MTKCQKEASPCYFCLTVEHLKWKTFNYEVWWIHCDGCGQRGLSCPSKRAAGNAWNEQVTAYKGGRYKRKGSQPVGYARYIVAVHGIDNAEEMRSRVENVLRDSLDLDCESDLEVTIDESTQDV